LEATVGPVGHWITNSSAEIPRPANRESNRSKPPRVCATCVG
jgi:hypothetical protein